MQRGITLDDLLPGHYDVRQCTAALEQIKATGADWVSLVVSWTQNSLDSVDLRCDEKRTLPDRELREVIGLARNVGLNLMLTPHVHVYNGQGDRLWQGNLGKMFTAAQWNEWFSKYREFILHYARMAEELGLHQFCVGAELVQASKQSQNWREVLRDVRQVYAKGGLTYAANHGKEARSIDWWDAPELTYIGIDAYYPLTNVANPQERPTVADLKRAWKCGIQEMAEVSANADDKKVVIVEIGYMSSQGTHHKPFGVARGLLNQEEQARCYEAARQALLDVPWLEGVFWYCWLPDPFHGGPCDDDFPPFGKPAENVIRSWYGAPARSLSRFEFTPPLEAGRLSIFENGRIEPGWSIENWGGAVNPAAVDPDDQQRRVVSVDVNASGGVEFGTNAPVDDAWEYLAFRIRGPERHRPLGLQVQCFSSERFTTCDGAAAEIEITRRDRPIDDLRYTPHGLLLPGVWNDVAIPLSHLNADSRRLSGFVIQDRCATGYPMYWVDNVRLIRTT